METIKLIKDIWNHPANHNSKSSALLRGIRWQCYKRLTNHHQDISYHGLKLRCYPNSHSASRAIYFSGFPDFREMKFMVDYLQPGDRFIDIGANIGLYTLLALSVVGISGHVDSFEPVDDTAKVLKESLTLNKIHNCTIHPYAAGEVSMSTTIVSTKDDCTAHIEPKPSNRTVTPEAKIVRIDEHLPDTNYAMAKLDIEGYEPFAIRGLGNWLANGNPPVLQLEMAGYSNRYGVTTTEFIAELAKLGYYTAIYLPDSKTLKATDRPWEVPVDNLLAVSRDHEAIVLDRLQRRVSPASKQFVTK